LQQNLENFLLYESNFYWEIGETLKKRKCSLRYIEFVDTQIILKNSLDWILQYDKLETLKFINSYVLYWIFPINKTNQKFLDELRCLVVKNYFSLPTDFIINIIWSCNLKLQEIEIKCLNDKQSGNILILVKISLHCENLTKLGGFKFSCFITFIEEL
jgi:predicted membrane-bound dolichyl-phosphate-mannose-protein mannosyltransferase